MLSGGGGSRTGVGVRGPSRRCRFCRKASEAFRPRGCGVRCGILEAWTHVHTGPIGPWRRLVSRGTVGHGDSGQATVPAPTLALGGWRRTGGNAVSRRPAHRRAERHARAGVAGREDGCRASGRHVERQARTAPRRRSRRAHAGRVHGGSVGADAIRRICLCDRSLGDAPPPVIPCVPPSGSPTGVPNPAIAPPTAAASHDDPAERRRSDDPPAHHS